MTPELPHPDDLVEEQVAYYRARAPEYDDWWLRLGRYERGSELDERWEAEKGVLADALRTFAPRGDVLELAAGTGNYTALLAELADSVTAVDASAETLDILRQKLPPGGAPVETIVADLFAWRPYRTYDVVFFSFWLSHVPPARWDGFWQLVRDALAPGGRAFFIDNAMPLELAAARVREDTGAGPGDARWSETDQARGVSVRELDDGRQFRIVKRLWEPDELAADLAARGWAADVHSSGFFLFGSAVPN